MKWWLKVVSTVVGPVLSWDSILEKLCFQRFWCLMLCPLQTNTYLKLPESRSANSSPIHQSAMSADSWLLRYSDPFLQWQRPIWPDMHYPASLEYAYDMHFASLWPLAVLQLELYIALHGTCVILGPAELLWFSCTWRDQKTTPPGPTVGALSIAQVQNLRIWHWSLWRNWSFTILHFCSPLILYILLEKINCSADTERPALKHMRLVPLQPKCPSHRVIQALASSAYLTARKKPRTLQIPSQPYSMA